MTIQHNIEAMNINRQMGISSRNGADKAEKLGSGYQINRSADDAAGLKISEKMRNQIRGLSRASQNSLEGDNFTKVADGALNEIHGLMQRQRELLVQAGNDTNTDEDRNAIQKEIEALSVECDRIFEDTEYNKIKVFRTNPKIHEQGLVDRQDSTVLSTDFSTNSTSREVWIPVTDPDPVTQGPFVTITRTDQVISSKYEYHERIEEEKENGHNVYYEEDVTVSEHLIETKKEEKTITYTKIDNAKYKTLKSPKDAMQNANGYLKVATEAGTLALSCAMTQLGLKVDGSLKSIDIYSSHRGTETVQGDKVINEYNMGSGITLRQTVELSGNDTYKIYYDITNSDSTSHTIDLRLAFDTMNMPGGFDTVAKSSTVSFVNKLKTSQAAIDISADASKGAMGDISHLYGDWDATRVVDGSTTSHHTGVGFWWENQGVPSDGQPHRIGEVTYGPIKITSNPYMEKTTIDQTITRERVTSEEGAYRIYTPHYLDIQVGAKALENIAIRQWDLSTEYLRLVPGKDISAFNADGSLQKMDVVLGRISAIRSYYGAASNDLNCVSGIDAATSENTQASESRIRDTDIAAMMIAYSQYSILQQAGQSMLAHANQSKQRVSDLLGSMQ